MELILAALGGTVLVLGAVFVLLAAIGILRLPDLLARMHAGSKAGVLGGGLILIAVAVLSGDAAVAVRAIIGCGFLFITTPLSAHLLARASYAAGTLRPGSLVMDEYKLSLDQTSHS
jgi:multicomponent Na+:H+ antiporter subunit G